MIYAGLELPEPAEGEFATDALILLKVITPTGVKYREWKSPDLHPIEALGMVETCRDTLKKLCMEGSRPIAPEEP